MKVSFSHFLARRCEILEKVDTNILKPQGINYEKEPYSSSYIILESKLFLKHICNFRQANNFNAYHRNTNK